MSFFPQAVFFDDGESVVFKLAAYLLKEHIVSRQLDLTSEPSRWGGEFKRLESYVRIDWQNHATGCLEWLSLIAFADIDQLQQLSKAMLQSCS